MIVYGGGSIIRNGLLQRIEDSLQQAGVDYVKLGGVQPNPTDPKVYEGIGTGAQRRRGLYASRRGRLCH